MGNSTWLAAALHHHGIYAYRCGVLRRLVASDPSPLELAEHLEQLLISAVEKQLTADVPVGVLTSGGLDSALIAVLAVAALALPANLAAQTRLARAEHDQVRGNAALKNLERREVAVEATARRQREAAFLPIQAPTEVLLRWLLTHSE